jgi:hypothetical protein
LSFGPAAALAGGDHVFLLQVFLHLVTGVTPGNHPGHGGHLLAVAAADLAAQQAARHTPDHRAGDALLIFHGRLPLRLHVAAALLGCHHGVAHGLHRDHVGELRFRQRLVTGDAAGAEHDHGQSADGDALHH